MKRFLLIVLLCTITTIAASAQVLRFRTTSFTSKERTSRGWTNWRPFESSDMLLTMDLNSDLVTIYSPTTQYYQIVSYNGTYTDNDGDTTASYSFYDQDGDRGTMRLVQRRNGRSEIYVDFANIMWCYSVIRL